MSCHYNNICNLFSFPFLLPQTLTLSPGGGAHADTWSRPLILRMRRTEARAFWSCYSNFNNLILITFNFYKMAAKRKKQGEYREGASERFVHRDQIIIYNKC